MTVTGKDASQRQAVLSQVEEDTAGENVACQSADWEERQAAQAAGLPLGKYRVYAEIAALDGAFTPEEAQSMTMRQLRDLLEELSGQGQAPAQEEGVESQPTEESASPGQGKAATARARTEKAMAASEGKGKHHKREGRPRGLPSLSTGISGSFTFGFAGAAAAGNPGLGPSPALCAPFHARWSAAW